MLGSLSLGGRCTTRNLANFLHPLAPKSKVRLPWQLQRQLSEGQGRSFWNLKVRRGETGAKVVSW